MYKVFPSNSRRYWLEKGIFAGGYVCLMMLDNIRSESPKVLMLDMKPEELKALSVFLLEAYEMLSEDEKTKNGEYGIKGTGGVA